MKTWKAEEVIWIPKMSAQAFWSAGFGWKSFPKEENFLVKFARTFSNGEMRFENGCRTAKVIEWVFLWVSYFTMGKLVTIMLKRDKMTSCTIETKPSQAIFPWPSKDSFAQSAVIMNHKMGNRLGFFTSIKFLFLKVKVKFSLNILWIHVHQIFFKSRRPLLSSVYKF